jgi:hypothetical protein
VEKSPIGLPLQRLEQLEALLDFGGKATLNSWLAANA